MNWAAFYTDRDAWLTALVLAAAMLIAWQIGRWHGRRLRLRSEQIPESKFDDAALALLGLLLGFTFSMAILKHEQRRLMVVADGNAIGDLYGCASLLNEPTRTELQNVIRDYATVRLNASRRIFDEATLQSVLNQSQNLQDRMTSLVATAIAEKTPIAVPLTDNLNAISSSNASRLAAIRDKLPSGVVILLILTAISSALLVGREQGASNKADIAGASCFIVVVAFAVYVILDLNLPGRGAITVSQEPIERVLLSMRK